MFDLWDKWSTWIDERPFTALTTLFVFVWVYESLRFGINGIVYTPVIFVSSFFLSIGTAIVLKLYFKEDRGMPIKNAMDYRRPSAHTLIAASLSTIASLMDCTLSPVMLIFVILTALARVHKKAHTYVEVVEGGIEGVIIGIFVYVALVELGLPPHF